MDMETFQKAFDELEAQKTLITNCMQIMKNLSGHYASLERSLAERAEALESKLQDLDSMSTQSLKTFSERESAISERESAALSLIELRRDTAVTEMETSPFDSSSDVPGSLRLYCQRMDSVGLLQFMVSRRTDVSTLKRELYNAVAEAVDPIRLVLDAVLAFVERQGKDDRCWACSMLLETLIVDDGMKTLEIPGSVKEKVETLAVSWKKKVHEMKQFVSAAEGQLFLQFIGAFNLQSTVEEDFVQKLIVDSVPGKEISKLASNLGLGEKLSEIVDELVKHGKEIEAVSIAHEAGLTGEFSPVSILKSYLQTSRERANAILNDGNHSLSATEESSNLELNALRSIIMSVASLELEKEFNLESPKRRVEMLVRAKAERKKTFEKRARAEGPTAFFRPSNTRRSSSRRELSVEYMTPPRNSYTSPSHGGYKANGPGPSGGSFDPSPTSSPLQSHYVPEAI